MSSTHELFHHLELRLMQYPDDLTNYSYTDIEQESFMANARKSVGPTTHLYQSFYIKP